jgi:RNA polymerase sigma-70 factor (ECF subfamily)
VIICSDPVETREESAEELAAKARGGCMRSFEQLVELYKGRLSGYLMQFVHNRHDAEDLAQETFVKAWRSIARYDSKYSFSTWLYTIGKNSAISFHRSKRRNDPLEEVEETLAVPETAIGGGDGAQQLWAAARKLKPKMYEVLWLKYAEEFEVAEIARVMNTNVIHVKVLLHRARNELGRRLQGREESFRK